ncbi:MAG: hypothetical protein ACYDFR_06665, partial [Candidatus Omnitrophota bacterium]
LDYQPLALANLKGALKDQRPDEQLVKLYKNEDLTNALSYLKILDSSIKFPGVTKLGHCITVNKYTNIFLRRDYQAFLDLRKGLAYIEKDTFNEICDALLSAAEFMAGQGVKDPLYVINIIALLHDIGDILDYGDHASRGAGIIGKVITLLGISDEKIIRWAEFVIKFHPEFGGIFIGERSTGQIINALSDFDNNAEKNMLLKLLVVLTCADILGVRDGRFFNQLKAEFMVGMLDFEKLERFDALEHRLKKFSCDNRDVLDSAKYKSLWMELSGLKHDNEVYFRKITDFIRAMQLDHCMEVFMHLSEKEIIKLLNLFYIIHEASGGEINSFDFTASRRSANLSRQFIREMLQGLPLNKIKGRSLPQLLETLSRRGMIVYMVGNTMMIDNRYLINVNRYFKAAAILDFAYSAARGRGTLTNRQLNNFLYMLHLANIKELMLLEKYWPIARLLHGFLGAIIKKEKSFDLKKIIHCFKGKGDDLESLLLEQAKALSKQINGYKEVYETLEAIRQLGDLGLLISWLGNKTIRLRYTAGKVDFGAVGFIKFIYALALLWQKNEMSKMTFLFHGEYRVPVAMEKIRAASRSLREIKTSITWLSSEEYIKDVLGLEEPSGYTLEEERTVINFLYANNTSKPEDEG